MRCSSSGAYNQFVLKQNVIKPGETKLVISGFTAFDPHRVECKSTGMEKDRGAKNNPEEASQGIQRDKSPWTSYGHCMELSHGHPRAVDKQFA